MSVRNVTVFTCDGCRASTTTEYGSGTPTGFHAIALRPGGEVLLCNICFGAVDWVVRFQRITVPPRVYRDGNEFSLRPVS